MHWTAGTYECNDFCKSKYHFLIGKNGEVYEGKFKPEDNLNTADGKYAPHVAKWNTGSIGVSYCGMAGYSYPDKNSTKYPLLQKQMESGFKKIAQLCKQYKISPDNVYTHYEVSLMRPDTGNDGKQDIKFIPYEPNLAKENIGNFIRNKVRWYLSKI